MHASVDKMKKLINFLLSSRVYSSDVAVQSIINIIALKPSNLEQLISIKNPQSIPANALETSSDHVERHIANGIKISGLTPVPTDDIT
jgi:hypothetical protein